jgi:hypothetical protein
MPIGPKDAERVSAAQASRNVQEARSQARETVSQGAETAGGQGTRSPRKMPTPDLAYM